MSGRGGAAAAAINNTNNNGKGNSGISGIPAGSRKIVQSLTEIVNCSESEIYAMLKECNMDPNEAVNRLLSQGFYFIFLVFFNVLSGKIDGQGDEGFAPFMVK